ncbi:MAG TPA: histidine phosphatase family protein [Thermoleophilaceae bacterium]
MKRLFLLRHAKSSRDDVALADRDRPLAPRGRRAAEVMARHLRDEKISPALVLCSPARRTRETLEAVAPSGEVRIEEELYGASGTELLELLQDVPDEIESVMLVGHNPAIEELALGLAADGARLEDMERKFPTGALATLSVPDSWRELGPGSAELVAFVTPKELR